MKTERNNRKRVPGIILLITGLYIIYHDQKVFAGIMVTVTGISINFLEFKDWAKTLMNIKNTLFETRPSGKIEKNVNKPKNSPMSSLVSGDYNNVFYILGTPRELKEILQTVNKSTISSINPDTVPINNPKNKKSKKRKSHSVDMIPKPKNRSNTSKTNTTTNMINELKKEILIKHKLLSTTDMINNALIISNLKKDDTAIKWLNYELSGYPKDHKDIPEYRKITATLDIGVHFCGTRDMFDMRKYPMKIRYAGGLSSLEPVINEASQKPNSKITMQASVPPELISVLRTEKNLPLSGANRDRVPYILSKSDLDSLIAGLRSRIITYISNI